MKGFKEFNIRNIDSANCKHGYTQIPNSLIWNNELTHTQKTILLIILAQEDYSQLSLNSIARNLGIKWQTVQTNVNALVNNGFLKIVDDEIHVDVEVLDDTSIIRSKDTHSGDSRSQTIRSVDTKNVSYDDLINNFLITYEEHYFIEIIKKFPDKVYDALKHSIDLIQNIDRFAEKYGITEALYKVRSLKLKIEKLREDKFIGQYADPSSLSHGINEALQKSQPRVIKRYIKQAYVFFPDTFDEFVTRYRKLYDTFPDDNIINEIKSEFDKIKFIPEYPIRG